ncbi:MAG: amine dehydrogenase large subunit [Proteobacteria bacterium]|nr:amine dehydrogenase large subunit [Pseudomonadota bacterium]
MYFIIPTGRSIMRFLAAGFALINIQAFAQITPEEISVETMPAPGANWFISKTGNGGYIFDATTGEMQGLLSLSRYTPAVTAYAPRREFYAAESYLSRGVYGDRTDIVAIYDFDNLSPIAEIEIPNHMARLAVRAHMGLMNDGRHLAVLNMNPGHSVSIIDVLDRVFVYEASTPGCAVIMPVADSDFLQVCGDGTLQLIQLDLSGFEENRERSGVFFNVIEDPIFDRATRSADGWYLISHAGNIFEVTTDDDEINISDGWNVQPEGEEGWRPGSRAEFITAHRDLGLIYVIMHEGGVDTHHENGSEIWVLDATTRRRVHRLELESPASSIMVTQEAEPKLIVAGDGTHVFDAITFVHERSIETPGADHFEDL